jgi:dihydrofolate reductase
VIISLIVAMDEKRSIGKNNRLPWHLASDLKRFKKLTMGHHLVMGRKTYESIGKSLPGREMVVVTHRQDYVATDCKVVHSLEEALKLADANNESEAFVIGGGEIFTQAVDLADKIYLTRVQASVSADVYFPEIDPEIWSIYRKEEIPQSQDDEYNSQFIVIVRKDKKPSETGLRQLSD